MLTDIETLVDGFVRDDASRITSGERTRAITMAVERYSKDRPRLKVEDITPTDVNTMPLPDAWAADFSELRSLEYPIGEIPPSLLGNDRWSLYQGPSGWVIKSKDSVRVAADTVRATYTIKHALTSETDTIPVGDREPMACWAAAILCEQLAAFYSGGSDSTIQADSAPGQSKAQEYAARARSLRKRYMDELGVDDKRSAPAGVVVQMEKTDSLGQPRLTHTGRWL